MDRVSTSGAYSAILTGLMASEARQTQIGQRISSGQIATNLKGYGGNAERLSAMQAANTQVSGYLEQTKVMAVKLTAQDQGLQQLVDAGQGARQAIANVLAAGDGSTLMQSLQSYFQKATAALNTTYDGQYLFSGGRADVPPTSAKTLADLTSAPSIASLFQNGQFVTTTQLDANTSVQTGVLADKVATPLYTALQNIQAYAEGPGGPFSGPLTAAQSAFLQSQLAPFDTVSSGIVEAAAENGVTQAQVSDAQDNLTQQQTMLAGLIGNLTDADVAQASTDMAQAQLSIQAAGQVLSVLRSSSLLGLFQSGLL